MSGIAVTVTYQVDARGPFLSLDPPSVELSDGQYVVWKLAIPQNLGPYVPAIRFATENGPFQSLRVAPHLQAVVGKGSAGPSILPSFPYEAAVVYGPPNHPMQVTSRQPGEVINRTTQPDTTPFVVVTYEPPLKPGEPGRLLAHPERLSLNDGDAPVWFFQGIPDGKLEVSFSSVPFGTRNPRLGPFDSLTFLLPPTGRTSGIDAVMVGVGFGDSPLGLYTYEMRVTNPAGDMLAYGDPIIDNGGPPG